MSARRSQNTWVMIAGGGTAGHLLPGLAVARALVARGVQPSAIQFVGAQRGIEAKLVPEAGFEVTLLPGRGLQRKLTFANVAAAWGIARAMARSVIMVKRNRPAVVLTLGGFASVAVAVAAVLWRVPLVVAEQNARAGAANRLVARFAKACAGSFPQTDLPHLVVTGNPVRDEFLAIAANRDIGAARRTLGVPVDRTLIVAFAGSLGSRRLNEAVYGAVGKWSSRTDLAIYHVIGARDWDQRPAVHTDGLHYRAVRYEERMDMVLAAASLAVCRSGGTTVAELGVVGVPSILVPLPIATRDHQRANARELVEVDAAVLVDDEEFDSARLLREVDALLTGNGGGSKLDQMSLKARAVGRPDAAEKVADLVELHADRGIDRP